MGTNFCFFLKKIIKMGFEGLIGTLVYYAIIGYIIHKTLCFISRFIRISLKDKYVLITGCDTGFGNMISKRLQGLGANVISGCLTEKGKANLQKEADASGSEGKVFAILMDVTKDESVEKALIEIKKIVGSNGLHAIINNAGVLRGEFFDTQSMKEWDFQLQVNVLGLARVTKAVLPLLIESKGRVINVASVAGIFGTEGTVSYNASKFAVVGLSDALRRELGDWGVKVSMVLPGIMNTPLWEIPLDPSNIQRIWDSLSPEQKKFYESKQIFITTHEQANFLVKTVNGDPKMVIDAMEQAVTARFPFRRYFAGYDTFAFRFLAMLPDVVSDKLWDARYPLLKMPRVLPAGLAERDRRLASADSKKSQ